jgi:serine O-acetyltransferase
MRSESADLILEDVGWWVRCMNDTQLLRLNRYSQFAYLSVALTEFRTRVHYHPRWPRRRFAFWWAWCTGPPQPSHLTRTGLDRGSSSSTAFATIVTAEAIGSHC